MVVGIVIINSTCEALGLGNEQALNNKQDIASSVIYEAFWMILVMAQNQGIWKNLDILQEDEVWERNKGCSTGNWRKGHSY